MTDDPHRCDSIESARHQLDVFAHIHVEQRSEHSLRQLCAAARHYSNACEAAASGVTAAKAQAKADERRGVRPCPSCAQPIMPAKGADGGPMRWLDAGKFIPHRCNR